MSRSKKRLKTIEQKMSAQVEQGMKSGWPILEWDANCVTRATLRSVLGLKKKPFCAADVMAGW